MKIVGIVGPIASGKGVLVRLLQKQGYSVLSLSDVVREKTKELGLEITRENLQNVGDQFRQQAGNDILAREIALEINKNPQKKFVIDAIRNPAEVEYLKKHFNAYILGITASPKKRFELMQKRGKSYDPKTWEEFEKLEARDRGISQESYGQQVDACLKLSDVIFDNNGSLNDFEQTMPYLLEKIVGK